MKKSIPEDIRNALNNGVVLPAIPLALNRNRKFDERRQRALLRYYLDAGAGGGAIAVHTTQFAVRAPEVNLYSTLLEVTIDEFTSYARRTGKPVISIAGAIGKTDQALKEAETASKYGYNAVLAGLAAFKDSPNKEIIKHCKAIADVIPVVGFYMQTAVGGRKLDVDFWREFAQIENVIAIKIAPFNRYQTLDVVRGVVESGRNDEISLYTGNDDNILIDLLTEYTISYNGKIFSKRIVGGLLGHWAVWTKPAVKLLDEVHKGRFDNDLRKALILANKITDCNSAFFDAAHNFAGCIAGIHEVLRRQGLFGGISTLDPAEKLSPGQKMEIDRVYAAYPELNDDAFVAENIDKWLS